jgi:UDP-N-acetylmuramyl pentapeptide phosphotransferase/UDP-N-acetylglucosamine-1-phosphate transferase
MATTTLPFVLGCFGVVALLLRWLLASGLAQRIALDHPNERSLHRQPVPRVGGLVLVSIATGAILFALPALRPLATVAIALMLLSAWDDRHGLPVALRLIAHLAAALLAAGIVMPASAPWVWLVAMVALTWGMNLYNFMDGSDGLAGGMAVIGFAALALAAGSEAAELALACACICAAAAGFLLHNFPPARVFLGDAGSIPLGFLAGALGLEGWVDGIWPLWFPLLVFSPFVVDATVTLALRIVRGYRPWQAHREHAYQRMVAGGLGHSGTALAWYVLMLACGASALAALGADAATQSLVLGGWAAIYAALLGFVRARLPVKPAD